MMAQTYPRKDNRQSRPTAQGGKVPPHSEAAEKAILGMLLLRAELLPELTVTDEDFYHEKHAIIYRAIRLLDASRQPVDSISVVSTIEEKDRDCVGGLPYIALLADSIPTTANIGYYDRIVADRAKQRRLIKASYETLEEAFDDALGVDEVDGLIDSAESRVLQIRSDDQSTSLARLSTISRGFFANLENTFNGTADPGCLSGLQVLDGKIGGLRRRDFSLLAARPAMGKTSLAVGIGKDAAREGKKVAIFSLEMGKEELYAQILSQMTGINGHAVAGRVPMLDDYIPILFKAAEEIEGLDLYIDDGVDLTPSSLRSKSRRLKALLGDLDLIIIDYIGLMAPDPGFKTQGKTDEVTAISRACKVLAKELNVHVMALSQLNRECEKRPNKRPMCSDLRDSGALEQDADLIMFVYRDEVYDEDSVDKGTAEIIIGKQRKGSIGPVRVSFDPKCTRFGNLMDRY